MQDKSRSLRGRWVDGEESKRVPSSVHLYDHASVGDAFGVNGDRMYNNVM